MHFLLFPTCLPIIVPILHQYTNQMAHFHLIYTIFSSQTVLIQQYKLIHVNFLLPKTYSSLFSSFLSLVGSPHGPPSLCPDSSPSELFHLSPVSSLLSTEALVGGLQNPGLAPPLFQNISLSWWSCKKTVCWNRITHMYRYPNPVDSWIWNLKHLFVFFLCFYYPYYCIA